MHIHTFMCIQAYTYICAYRHTYINKQYVQSYRAYSAYITQYIHHYSLLVHILRLCTVHIVFVTCHTSPLYTMYHNHVKRINSTLTSSLPYNNEVIIITLSQFRPLSYRQPKRLQSVSLEWRPEAPPASAVRCLSKY